MATDRGDDSPEGELTDGILDQLGKYERAKIVERTRRGKLRKAREGNIVNSKRTRYGFEANAAGTDTRWTRKRWKSSAGYSI